jgi:hypothetical protein
MFCHSRRDPGGLVNQSESAIGSRVRTLVSTRFVSPVLTPADGVSRGLAG